MDTIDLSGLDLHEKEQRILESAILIFSEKGFSAATTSEIAKKAGVAEGTIFRYFKTKKDILRGILVQTINLIGNKLVVGQIEKILLEHADKDLRTILKEVLYDRMQMVDSIYPMARVVITEALYHEDIREAVYENIIAKALAVFQLFHQKMAEKGILRNDLEPDVLFRSILGNMAILIAQKKMFHHHFNLDDIDREFEKMLDVLLFGIAKREEDLDDNPSRR